MKLRVIQSIECLERIKPIWDGHLQRAENNNPFIEFDWIFLWWSVFGQQYELFVIAIEEDEDVKVILPLMKRKGLFIEHIYFIGYGQANYMDAIANDVELAKAIEFIMQHLTNSKKPRLFHFHGLFEDSDFYFPLYQYLQVKRIANYRSMIVCPVLQLTEIQFDQYFAKRKKKHGLDRKERRLKELGAVSFEPLRKNDIEKMFSLHTKRWEEKNDTSGFSEGKTKEFFQKLLQAESAAFQTKVDALYVDDRLIAYLYGFECRSRYLFYLPAHDDDYGKFSPGRILFKQKIADCVQSEIEIFDMSIGYEPYKFDWSNETKFAARFIFPSKHSLARIFYFVYSAKARLIDSLKKNRKLVLFKRNFLGKVKSRVLKSLPFWHGGKKG